MQKCNCEKDSNGTLICPVHSSGYDMQKEIICDFCGKPLEVNSVGRPRKNHDDCRKLFQLMQWSELLIQQIDFAPDQARSLRSRCWSMANLLNGVGL